MNLTPLQHARLKVLADLVESQKNPGFSTYDIIHDARSMIRGEPAKLTYLGPDELIVALARRVHAPDYRVARVWSEEQDDKLDLKIAAGLAEQLTLQATDHFICWID